MAESRGCHEPPPHGHGLNTRLSLIVPTCGRATLTATLRSILSQVEPTDQVIVISDGRNPATRRMVAEVVAATDAVVAPEYVEHPRVRGPGGRLRNYALDHLVEGTHVAAIDDDDIYLPGALSLLREAATTVPTIFRMKFGAAHRACGTVLWHKPKIAFSNVGTPMVVAPVGHSRFGLEFASDFVYYCSLMAEFQTAVWREEVIAEIRPVAPA